MNATATYAPYITRDTYVGDSFVNASRKSGVFTAAELAAMADRETGIVVLWEFSGHVHGRPLFGRGRYVAQADGSLVGYDSDGAMKIIHPADRKIRVMTK